MLTGNNILKLITTAAIICAIVSTAVLIQPRISWSDSAEYAAQALKEAEKARSEAEKAVLAAERAIEDAEKAMADAEKNKQDAKKDKAKAMEQMVQHGYFPDDFSMDAPDGKVSAVFSHKKHTEREQLRCVECHPKVFLMKVGKNVVKKGHLTMDEMKKGKYCGNCHNGHKAFSVTSIQHCKRCHPKQ
ncbi:MAG: cytochrome c3 family protein [Proteobacteria bacterium]|nr:cytochrome c3 family protein [Pseudomonadota bacterium]MBU1710957.1 cytochrome c3 family protein [Pseudomonadota bacterium]